MILDQFGRPMQRVPTSDLLERQAVPGLGSVRQIHGGHPADGLTPPRLTGILRQAEMGDATAYLELAEQMEEKDLHYAAVLGVRKRAIRSLEIQVDAGDETKVADEAADMVRQTLNTAAVKTSLIDMMDALGKGFSVSEIIWEREGHGLRLAGLELVDPRWFEFEQTNGSHIFLRDNAGPQPLRSDSFVIHVARAKSGLAIRGGLARLAAWAYLFKNFSLKDWSIFLEAYGHPLRLGRYGPSSSMEDRLTLLRAARQIGVDMAAIIPKDMDLEVINAATSGADKLYEGNARYWDEQISKGVLGQVATTDALAGGHAVGKIHEEVRGDIRDADAEQLAGNLQRDIAGAIVRLNFAERHRVALPVIRFVAPERADPKLMMELLEKGPKAGLKIAVSQVRAIFALREPEDGEEVLTAPAPTPDPSPVAAPVPPVTPDAAAVVRQTAAQISDPVQRDSIDALVDELIQSGDLEEAVTNELGDMIEAIGKVRTIEEVQDILAAFDDAVPGGVRELLDRSTYAARLAGEVGAPVR
jgi:phage gp29-like protein